MGLKKQWLSVFGATLFSVTVSSHASYKDETFFNNRVVTPALVLSGANDVLGGDAGLACEILVCLAAVGSPPSECTRPLKKYFSLKPKRRANFLALCPKVGG